jgi:2-dehydro-3-deoxyphosphooctonate aldolase (KDO 8-P synthase)
MKKMTIIAGNCVLENIGISLETAEFLCEQSRRFNFDLIYKSSFKKDNRSSCEFFRGPELQEAIDIFKKLKEKFSVKILSDFHNLYELDSAITNYVDVLQLPAYLCMQTELTIKMAKMQKNINIKKGQFLHPDDVKNIINKFVWAGNNNISITERGTCFGYRDLVVDPRSFYILKSFGYPVFFDVGHSIRKYGIPSSNLKLGGEKQYVNILSSAAIACKIDGLFVEVHPNPPSALCDAATQLSFSEFEKLMKTIIPIWEAVYA